MGEVRDSIALRPFLHAFLRVFSRGGLKKHAFLRVFSHGRLKNHVFLRVFSHWCLKKHVFLRVLFISCLLGASLGYLGASLRLLRGSWGLSRRHLGPPGEYLGPLGSPGHPRHDPPKVSWGFLGGRAPGRLLAGFLGLSWTFSWGTSWNSWGPSWGASWEPPEGSSMSMFFLKGAFRSPARPGPIALGAFFTRVFTCFLAWGSKKARVFT